MGESRGWYVMMIDMSWIVRYNDCCMSLCLNHQQPSVDATLICCSRQGNSVSVQQSSAGYHALEACCREASPVPATWLLERQIFRGWLRPKAERVIKTTSCDAMGTLPFDTLRQSELRGIDWAYCIEDDRPRPPVAYF